MRVPERGAALLTLALLMSLMLLPLMIFVAKRGAEQVRTSMIDRRIKDNRHLLESPLMDAISNYNRDWRKDHVFAYLNERANPGLNWTLGASTATVTSLSTMNSLHLLSTGRTWAPGKDVKLNTERKMEALVTFRQDLLRFDWVWRPGSGSTVRLTDLPAYLKDNTHSDWDRTVFVKGDLDATTGIPITLQGFWFIDGDFTTSPSLTLGPGALVHCRRFNGSLTNAGGVVREFPDRLVPNLFLDGPERDIGLEYYRSFHTWPLTKPDGNYLDNPWVNFSPGPSPHVRAIIKDLNGTVADRWDFSYQTSDPVTEPYVSPRRIVLVEGTDLTITASTITCPMVVVCLEDPNTHAGGHVTIKGDNWYEASDNGQKADSHHSFSVLAQKSLTFDNPSGVPQTLRGFFYSGENKIVVDNPHDVYITGTVQGFPSEGFGFLPFDDPRFEVTADPWLAVYTPPQIPRRPVVVSFR